MSTLEVVIEEDGTIHPVDATAKLPAGRATLVLGSAGTDLYEASESGLRDWLRPEEDEAWAYLQQAK